MTSRREFITAIVGTHLASAVSDINEVGEDTTSLILTLKSPINQMQTQMIAQQCEIFNRRRVECGYPQLPVLIVDGSKITIEQVQ